jgi:hypothetical protein
MKCRKPLSPNIRKRSPRRTRAMCIVVFISFIVVEERDGKLSVPTLPLGSIETGEKNKAGED